MVRAVLQNKVEPGDWVPPWLSRWPHPAWRNSGLGGSASSSSGSNDEASGSFSTQHSAAEEPGQQSAKRRRLHLYTADEAVDLWELLFKEDFEESSEDDGDTETYEGQAADEAFEAMMAEEWRISGMEQMFGHRSLC